MPNSHIKRLWEGRKVL